MILLLSINSPRRAPMFLYFPHRSSPNIIVKTPFLDVSLPTSTAGQGVARTTRFLLSYCIADNLQFRPTTL